MSASCEVASSSVLIVRIQNQAASITLPSNISLIRAHKAAGQHHIEERRSTR